MLVDRARFALLSLPLVIGVALTSPGCGNTGAVASSGTGGAGGAGGAPVGCPPDIPQGGDACQVTGACHYPEPCCGDTIATCTSGRWHVAPGACVGKVPAPQCPTDAPAPGTPCMLGCTHEPCPYGTCPGSSGPAFTAKCNGATWLLEATCDAGG